MVLEVDRHSDGGRGGGGSMVTRSLLARGWLEVRSRGGGRFARGSIGRGVLSWGLGLLLVLAAGVAEAQSEPPSTRRSRRAIRRVRPALSRALQERRLRFGAPIFIRIFKENKELEVWVERGERFVLFKTYRICTYSGRLGPKLRTGDQQAPEGFYFVNAGRMNPASTFHLSFNLGYPNRYDRAHGRTGSALMVHGNCVSIGCYAMTDERIEEIFALADAALRGGQPFFRVHVFPFRMTAEKVRRQRASPNYRFWLNLKEGYDHFETHRRPPNVEVRNRRYVFERS